MIFSRKRPCFPVQKPNQSTYFGQFLATSKNQKKSMFLVISSQFISTFKTKKIEIVKMREDGKDMGISMIIYVVFSLFSIFYPFPQPFQIRFLTRPRLSSPHWLDSACQWSVIRGPFGRCHQKSIHAQSSRRGTSTCLRLRKSVNPLKN